MKTPKKRSTSIEITIKLKPKTLKILQEYARTRQKRSLGTAIDYLIECAGDIIN